MGLISRFMKRPGDRVNERRQPSAVGDTISNIAALSSEMSGESLDRDALIQAQKDKENAAKAKRAPGIFDPVAYQRAKQAKQAKRSLPADSAAWFDRQLPPS